MGDIYRDSTQTVAQIQIEHLKASGTTTNERCKPGDSSCQGSSYHYYSYKYPMENGFRTREAGYYPRVTLIPATDLRHVAKPSTELHD